MSDQRAFRGVWIPADLWLNRSLSIQEKVMLIEIDSLAKDPVRGCYKKNQGFAEFFGLSKNRVSEIIKSLETKGFIRVHYQRKGQEIVERNIFIIAPFDKPNTPSENCDTPFGKSGEPPSENCEERGSSFRGSIEGSSIGTSADAPCSFCSGEGLIIGVSRLEDCHHCNGTGKEPTCNDGLQVQDVRNSRTTEQPVDWSKAPDDATHWASYTSQSFETGEFAKNVGGRWWIFYGGSWGLLHAKRDFIPRPNPVVNSELTTEKQKSAYPEEFEWIWKNKPERHGSNGKKSAYNACMARIKQGATWRELAEGMKRYAAHCKADGKLNTPYVMQMVKFFGPDEHYKNQWSAVAPVKSGAPCPTSTSNQERQFVTAEGLTQEQREENAKRIREMKGLL